MRIIPAGRSETVVEMENQLALNNKIKLMSGHVGEARYVIPSVVKRRRNCELINLDLLDLPLIDLSDDLSHFESTKN